jgi:hypothetical protein
VNDTVELRLSSGARTKGGGVGRAESESSSGQRARGMWCRHRRQNPHPFDALRAGSVAKNATRMGCPDETISNGYPEEGI